jgi:prepilin-type N-terminal cleavage/methylation domain-containing protein
MQVFARKDVMSQRRGFTMIELLVVVSIIALLAALTVNVIGDSVDQAREAATATTILKVNEMLEKRVEAFSRAMSRSAARKKSAAGAQQAAKSFAGWPTRAVNNPNLKPLRERVAEIIGYKTEFRRSFPQLFRGVAGTVPTEMEDREDHLQIAPGIPNGNGFGVADAVELVLLRNAESRLLQQNPGVPPTPAQIQTQAQQLFANHTASTESQATESSEMLYLIITEFDVFGAPAAGSDQFLSGEVADTDGDSLLEFVDSWGQPLRFYRWPTRLLRPGIAPAANPPLPHPDPINRAISSQLMRGLLGTNPLIRDPLSMDPDDPIGLVDYEIQRLARTGTLDLTTLVNEGNFHTLNTFHTPLVVSMGKDGALGLFEPNDYTNLGHLCQPNLVTSDELTDNITNRNRRAGGRN